MGIKKLEQVLDTHAIIQKLENDSNIYIGSPYVHDLIIICPSNSVHDKCKIKFNSIFDYNPKDITDSISMDYNKLLKLVENSELDDIINSNDLFDDNTLVKVYTYKNGKIITEFAEKDKLGYPHTTIKGYLMYDNTYFTDIKEARIKNRKEELAGLEWCPEWLNRDIKQLAKTIAMSIKQVLYFIRSYLN